MSALSTLPPSTDREIWVRVGWALTDTAVVISSVYVAAWLRHDLNFAEAMSEQVGRFALMFGALFGIVAVILSLLAPSHRRGSFEETAQVLKLGLIAGVIAGAAVFLTPWFSVPRSLPFVAPAIALLGMFAVRFVIRSYRWGRTVLRDHDKPVIIFGAGRGGQQLVRALVNDVSTESRLVPVAVLDDDPRKRRWRLQGIRVRGGLNDLVSVVEETGAKTLAVAIPSIEQEALRRIQEKANELDLDVLILPTAAQLLGSPKGADLRKLNLEDLLGRRRITLDSRAIANSLNGKTVLVTGAGGSIGSELCRQIARFGPAKLTLLDRDESALFAAQMSLTGRALLDDGTLALGDIRDLDAIREIMDHVRPDIVFHAAALKHLTLLEQYPLEAWKTNVLGTRNVLEAARSAGVKTFVNVSTDKAADPTCVLGYSKRVAERLTADYASNYDSTYVSVRFGNVLGSRGSVLTAFTEQIERGGPVTVTHPDVERYFMLIPEACQLVLQAASIGSDGEVMVLDMGEPLKILDVAKQMIRMSGKRDINIDFTGLRPGEKLSEVLFSSGDRIQQSGHQLVHHVAVPRIDAAMVSGISFRTPAEAREWMVDEGSSLQGAAL